MKSGKDTFLKDRVVYELKRDKETLIKENERLWKKIIELEKKNEELKSHYAKMKQNYDDAESKLQGRITDLRKLNSELKANITTCNDYRIKAEKSFGNLLCRMRNSK